MQDQQIKSVASNIEFLQEQIEKTSNAEMKSIFYTIIQEQIKSRMLAEASPEYVFVAVSPSMVPEKKSQPKRALICVLGTLLAGMLAVLAALIAHYSQQKTLL
jgi:LPS O-antigen subunit length determinant protein (WzzB/FepE family)